MSGGRPMGQMPPQGSMCLVVGPWGKCLHRVLCVWWLLQWECNRQPRPCNRLGSVHDLSHSIAGMLEMA